MLQTFRHILNILLYFLSDLLERNEGISDKQKWASGVVWNRNSIARFS